MFDRSPSTGSMSPSSTWKKMAKSFMVVQDLRLELADELKRVTLYTTISRAGGLFLWPVRLPEATGRRNSWAESSRRGAELAMQNWTRLTSNRSAGQYDLAIASATLPEPEWPDLPFKEILRLAFKDALIADIDHPAVRRLRGQADEPGRVGARHPY